MDSHVLLQLVSENSFKSGYPGVGGQGTAPDFVDKFYYDQFPEDFEWGVATAAYLTEGAWDTDGEHACWVLCLYVTQKFNKVLHP